jgi:Big-like domain-containing protein
MTLLVADRVMAITMRRQSGSVPPAVSIVSPASGSTVSGIVAVQIQASDDVGVRQVQLSINASLVATWFTTPYQFNWDSRGVSDGAVTLTALAVDYAGLSASALATLTVANRSTPGRHDGAQRVDYQPGGRKHRVRNGVRRCRHRG